MLWGAPAPPAATRCLAWAGAASAVAQGAEQRPAGGDGLAPGRLLADRGQVRDRRPVWVEQSAEWGGAASEGVRYEVIRAIVLEDSLCLQHGHDAAAAPRAKASVL